MSMSKSMNMSRIVSEQIIKNYTSLSRGTALSFHKIPYHLQYECRDFNTKNYDKPSVKTLMNRENYIKNYNPFLRTNVSENLDRSIAEFYRKKFAD